MRRGLLLLTVAVAVAACEDGPKQVYEPLDDDPAPQNGFEPTDPLHAGGDASVPLEVPGCNADELGESRFCCEQEHEAVVQRMVQEPIIPDVSIGGVPMWSPEGPPTHADSLPGKSSAGLFCDPDIYSNALTWGPTNEVIAFINEETHIIELIVATEQYLGKLEGEFTRPNRETGEPESATVVVAMRKRINLAGRDLDQYAEKEDQETATNSWLNHKNVTDLWRFVRQNYFQEAFGDHPADYNCVTDNKCNLIYNGRDTLIYMVDSGVIFAMQPDGTVVNVAIEPVRVAPFQDAPVTLGDDGAGEDPGTLAVAVEGENCTLTLADRITWGRFTETCLGDDADRATRRFTYDVYGQRDAVSVDLSGISLAFLHDIEEHGVLKDGERPNDADRLFEVTITRQLNAPVDEFRHLTLAQKFKTKLEARLRAAVDPSARGGEEPVEGEDPPAAPHPFLTWELVIPDDFDDDPQPMDRLMYATRSAGEQNWIEKVTRDIDALYRSLTPEEAAQVDPLVKEPTWIIEPFVDGVLEQFTHGLSNADLTWKSFQNTDDKKWVIGSAHFIQDGLPYRVTVQYSLNYGAVTALTIAAGFSPIDEVYNGLNEALREAFLGQKSPYYSIDLAQKPATENPLALGGKGLELVEGSYTRLLSMADVKVTAIIDGQRTTRTFTVPVSVASDRGGYTRQLRGERWEFVPATLVQLYGKETILYYYLDEAIGEAESEKGRIGRIVEPSFKGVVNLCPGLEIRYGDYVREKVQAFIERRGFEAFRNCDIVFNYSENGNVLDEVASLANRVAFTITNGRATTAALWR